MRDGEIQAFTYQKAAGTFTIAVTQDENVGWGSNEWKPPVHDLGSALALCRELDPMFERAPSDEEERLRKLTGAATKPKRAGAPELRKALEAVLAADGDTVLLDDDIVALITAALR